MKKFLQKIGAKNAIVISGVMLIGIAVYLNVRYTPLATADPSVDEALRHIPNMFIGDSPHGQAALVNADISNDHFAITQMNRARARDEAIETLMTVAEMYGTAEDIREEALRALVEMARDVEKETNVETLMRAKGFTDSVAVINGDLANIIVRSEGLLPVEVAQIKEIVVEAAGIHPVNIRIIETS